jgi:hypothetical protein
VLAFGLSDLLPPLLEPASEEEVPLSPPDFVSLLLVLSAVALPSPALFSSRARFFVP